MQVEGKGETVKNAAIDRTVRDSIIICTFPGMLVTDALLPGMLSSLFGEPWTADDVKQAGMRAVCQERLFNAREGLTRKDDILPGRLLYEPKPDGPTKGAVVPLEELKNDYYRAMGWDMETGNPPDSLLAELGIEK
ncbi:aldehyde ferredoxin oxidoreductase C-terminal domain-containing protein [Chloroflexota bacterium]